jgi:CDP-diacylglycerol--glycerol-3-phosphate 3-phosphatidyltransferase
MINNISNGRILDMQTSSPARNPTLLRLRLRWIAFTLFSLIFLVGGFFVLSNGWSQYYAARWLVLPVPTVVYLLLVLTRNLSANHRPDEERLLASLGWGNTLTLLRGLFVAALLGFLLLPRPLGWLSWIPGILFVLSDVADFLDGYLARITNHATRLGEILDMSFDGIGVLAAVLLGVQYGQLPAWYLLIGFSRYLFLGGQWLRKRLDRPVYKLPSSISRRGFAGLMMGFLAAALLPVFRPPGLHIAATLFGLPFLVGFIRDWLTVSGVIQSGNGLTKRISRLLLHWLPLALRLAILALILIGLFQWIEIASKSNRAPLTLVVFNLVIVVMIVLGVAPRITSILGLCLLGLFQAYTSLTSVQITLAIAYTAILYLGGGAYSLWKPEEFLVYKRAGEGRFPKIEAA